MILHFNPRSHERSDFEQWYVSNGFSISIHAPTRGATNMSVQIICIVLFQSTLPRDERQWWGVVCTSTIYISIHAPTRGATLEWILILLNYIFQSTLPREERHLLRPAVSSEVYFNPRSHERSDVMRDWKRLSYVISIHAPTRGATDCLRQWQSHFFISIHAPTRGATLCSPSIERP